MPTYTVINSNFSLKPKQKNELAKGITKIHNVVTGANTYFAQVIFNKTKNTDHFMGGKKVKEPSLFLHGLIRAGRSKKVKDKLPLRDYISFNIMSTNEILLNLEYPERLRDSELCGTMIELTLEEGVESNSLIFIIINNKNRT